MDIPNSFAVIALDVAHRDPTIVEAVDPFMSLVTYIQNSEAWEGACHALAAVMYLLFQERGIPATLCLGEAQLEDVVFDHSWVQIGEDVFDVAVSQTLLGPVEVGPTFRSTDLSTGQPSRVAYGINSGQPRGRDASAVLSTPFHRFMSRYPLHPEGLWGITREVGNRIRMELQVAELKQKYGYDRTEWTLR